MAPLVHVLTHPLVQRDLSLLRAIDTSSEAFRAVIRRISRALAVHALADVATREVAIETPLEATKGQAIAESVVLVPVLRAGLGLVDGFLDALPEARVLHLGLVRDEETLRPSCYLSKLSSLRPDERVYVLDPMLATGGSAVAALDMTREMGLERPPTFVCVVAAPEGIAKLHQHHADVPILTASVDRGVDENGYIRPGLGDAGDRLFGG
ncbi:MAG: uracil phosphoribosyltransferase [Myxococcales bacterium]|nr:uracil phosphoribosyltransferase [Myxococcales bacterium]MCB9704202.1 uracil phosphoribosyltransferase [Myxococcales bacterium]